MTDQDQNLDWARASLVLQARQSGIMDGAILKALETVPREMFVPQDYIEHAYRDVSVPIGAQQSMISPVKLAKLFDALATQDTPSKVLEIGTGSGYGTALLARLCKRVFTIERQRGLLRAATQRWQNLKISNIIHNHDDGLNGWSHQAPFPKIILMGSVRSLPPTIVDQLAEEGTIIAAIGEASAVQKIVQFTKIDGQLDAIEKGEIRLQPLISGKV